MRYALIAAALVGAVAASPAWAPPAYGGSGDDSWGSASTVDQTTVVTVTSCAATVTDCPGNAPPTGYPVTTPASEVIPPPETSEASTPYSPETTSAGGWGPPAYGSPSAPASAPASSPYSPEQPSAPASQEVPPPAYTSSASAPPPAETPYSPIGGSAPAPPPSYPSAPVYPVPGNGTYSPSGTASGAPSASNGYPVQQTGNSAAGLKAGSFIAGMGAFAALLL